MRQIEIWWPRYKDDVALVGKKWVRDYNIIYFSKAKHLKGMRFAMSREEITSYPLDNNGKIECYAVPMDDLMEKEI